MAGLIAVDWGTTRLRAYRLDESGAVVARSEGPDGIAAVPAGGFADVLARHAGAWLADTPGLPVLMAGMVGSRNGWREAAYAAMPCGAAELAANLLAVERQDGGAAAIVPGIAGTAPSGMPDVMRGEETLVLGLGLRDGLVCLPGTHSKWVEVEGGRIARFASFMTGESFGLYARHSILGRLIEEPADRLGLFAGAEAACNAGGLLHALFSARTRVLAGEMQGHAVEPYLSGLLIRAEIDGAVALFPQAPRGEIVLVAEGAVESVYAEVMAGAGLDTRTVVPEAAFVQGIGAIRAARGGV